MVKKKNAVALFEVISKIRAGNAEPDMSVPGWMTKQSAAQAREAGDQEPAKATPAATDAAKPMVSTVEGRLRLSLNYVTCTAAAFALVVLLVLAFWLGRATARPAVATAEQAGVGLANDASPPSLDAAVSEPPPSQRVVGKHYLVIQNLQGDDERREAEARRIVAYCTANREPATVNTYLGSIVVWSLKPFDKSDTQGIRSHALKLEKLGDSYFRRYRTYDFRQRRQVGGELDPMVLPWSPEAGR